MKIKQLLEKHRKKIIIISVSLITVVVVAGGIGFYCIRKNDGLLNPFAQSERSGFQVSGDMIGASGVTSVGVTEESFQVENLSAKLEIEEVYIASNDTVEAGTKVAKLSEESVSEAREELEQVLKEAELAYRAGVIAYEQNKITALYERDSAVLGSEQAQEVYDETVSQLQSNLEKAQEELEEAKEQIAEYESYVNDGSYRSYFKIDEYQATYDETLRILVDKMDEWGVSWSQVTSGASGSGMSGSAVAGTGGGMSGNTGAGAGSETSGNAGAGTGSGTSGDANASVSGGDALTGSQNDSTGSQTTTANNQTTTANSQYVSALSSLYSILEDHLNNLEQAESDYEDAVANAAFELQTLQLKLPSLEQAVIEAQENYDTQVLQAKLTYETSLSDAENADSDYETALQKAESDYETLKKEWEDAQENLELFESSVGDGYFYAGGSGTVLRTMIRKGEYLTSESVVFMYSNPEEMTVTVSVDQEDIAGIALGDSVSVQSAEYGSFEGTVTEVNPVSNSGSRTNVTYSVTVTLSGDTSAIPANTSVTVIFGMDESAVQLGTQGAPDGEQQQQSAGEEQAE